MRTVIAFICLSVSIVTTLNNKTHAIGVDSFFNKCFVNDIPIFQMSFKKMNADQYKMLLYCSGVIDGIKSQRWANCVSIFTIPEKRMNKDLYRLKRTITFGKDKNGALSRATIANIVKKQYEQKVKELHESVKHPRKKALKLSVATYLDSSSEYKCNVRNVKTDEQGRFVNPE